MKVFDAVDASALEQRELHLWVVALGAMVVMAMGLALMMYTAIFFRPVVFKEPLAKKAFFGFCTLSILLFGYFVDRQIVILKLRKRVELQKQTLANLRHQASHGILAALPGADCFRDCLAMECLRSSVSQQSFSVVTVRIFPGAESAIGFETTMTFGDALKAISRKLRDGDSVYSLDEGAFGIVLPGVGPMAGKSFARRLTEGLYDAAGVSARFSFKVDHANYPDEVTTSREMERKILEFSQIGSSRGAENRLEHVVAGS